MLPFNKFNIYSVLACLNYHYKSKKKYYQKDFEYYQVVVNIVWQQFDGNEYGDYEILCEPLSVFYTDENGMPFVYERYMDKFIKAHKKLAEEGKFPAWISGYIEMCGQKEAYTDFSVDEYTVKQYI